MLPIKKLAPILLIGLFILTACSRGRETSATPAAATTSPQPIATEIKILPTPSSPGDSIIWENLQVTLDQLEITEDYTTNYGSRRVPPAGKKFLWVHIRLENTSSIELDMPVLENYSILYAATEIKPIYGHRQGHVEYTTFGPVISPNQEFDGWLRFDIPVAAELSDLRFVFIPESAQVGVSFSSPNFPYAENKPTYVWNCAP
jgi:hypothetical protein